MYFWQQWDVFITSASVKLVLAAATVVSAILAGSAAAQSPALELRGAAHAEAFDVRDLEGLTLIEVTVDEGGPATYRGPTLRDLATRAGAPTGRALRGSAMALAILVEASDGYVVAFTVAELDEQFGARQAIVALSRNGAPIEGDDGPLRLVVPEDDQFHARWVRGLVRITLVDLGAARPQAR